MRSNAQLKEAAEAQVSASDYIPHGTHVTANVIKNKETGDYVATWRLEGITFETSDPQDILVAKNGLTSFIHALGGGQWAVWTHRIRRHVHERLGGDYKNEFCAELNKRYYESFDAHRQMATELYITLVYRPNTSRVAGFFKRLSKTKDEIRAAEQEHLDVVDDMAKQLESSLRKYDPERLGAYHKNGHLYSEMLSFYGFLVNGVWEDIPMRRAEIAEYLPTSRLHFGDKNGTLEIWHPTHQKYVGFMDFQEYPARSEPGMNNVILYGNYEYIETQSFAILNKRDAKEALDHQAGALEQSESASETEIKEMQTAKDQLAAGHIEIGEYHYSLAVFGDNADALADHMGKARAKLQDTAGFKMATIDAIPECAWFAQLPGNFRMRPREAKITSRNFVSLSPFHGFARGKRNGNPWGEAVCLFRTPSGQPYAFNFHTSPDDTDNVDDKYPANTFICGFTGVGKTTVAVALLCFLQKVRGLRVVAFDKDRGMEIAIRVMGGKYSALPRGVPTGFNPLQLEPTETNIQFVEKLVRQLLVPAARPGETPAEALTAREEAVVSEAVRTVMSPQVGRHSRRLAAVSQLLSVTAQPGKSSLKDRLRKWVDNGPLAWVFDNPQDTLNFTQHTLFGFDYTDFLDDSEVCTPIMSYLLHVMDTLIDGQPFTYYMTEFWKVLDNPYMVDFVRNKQKTIRKENGFGMFDTQEPNDAVSSVIGKTMVSQCVTQLYLPNPKADHDDYVNGFKLTESEFRTIAAFEEHSRKFLVKQGHRSTVVQFDLGGMNDILTVISGSTDNVELLDVIRAEVGDDPKDFLPILYERIAARKAQKKTKSTVAA